MKISTELQHAFKLSIPTLFAYFPLGMVFTILWLKAGFPAFWAPMMSVFAYAGAAQFVALSMMQEQASLLAIIIAVSFIAFRNVFYGLSLIERFKNKPLLIKVFLIFGLVDATYGILMSNPENPEHNDTSFCLYASLFPYLYWVSGTILGLFVYNSMPEIKGLDFMLTSFFMILCIDYYLVSRDKLSLFMPIIFAVIGFIILPHQYLLASIIFSLIFVHMIETRNHKENKQD